MSAHRGLVVCSLLSGDRAFRSERHRVVTLPCRSDTDYSSGLGLLWRTSGAIINVEHDMECSDELIDRLLACPELLCTHAYRMHHLGGTYAQAVGRKAAHGGGRPVHGGETYADFSGIGFCKIAAPARAGCLERTRWDAVEMAVHGAIHGPWHVHWPEINHHHR